MSTWVPEPHAPTCPSLPSPILSRVLIRSPYPPPFKGSGQHPTVSSFRFSFAVFVRWVCKGPATSAW